MNIAIDTFRAQLEQFFRLHDYTGPEVDTFVNSILYAQSRGNDHGLTMLIKSVFPKKQENRQLEVIEKTKLSALVNANHCQAILAVQRAVEIALLKAKEHGFGIVGVNQLNTSSGALGYFADSIACHGYIGFLYAKSPPRVAPYGSYERVFGTNPLAIGLPSVDGAVVLDMSTASVSWGGVEEKIVLQEQLAEGVAYDSSGRFTTDPLAVLGGALTVFDNGHKGSGLSFMVEVLAGPLAMAGFSGSEDNESNSGNLVYVLDPQLLVETNVFREQVSSLIERLHRAKKLSGVENIYAPGERGKRVAKKVMSTNTIEIADTLYKRFLILLE